MVLLIYGFVTFVVQVYFVIYTRLTKVIGTLWDPGRVRTLYIRLLVVLSTFGRSLGCMFGVVS